MDKKKGVLNIVISMGFKIILLIGSILVRRFLIQYIGNDANGLSSLYMSIIGFLTVAELGVGEAITFCMYKPIVEKDTEKVAALYQLFKKLYMIIGGIILIAGMIVMFFLPSLAKDYAQLDINVYWTFALTLVSVVMTYAYSAKISLINAHKYNYISTGITSTGTVVEDILKIGAIVMTQSFEAYLVCGILAVTVQWILATVVCEKKFPDIIANRTAKIDVEGRVQLTNNIRAMFMHKIGGALVNATDSVIISVFVGVVALGRYSNYTAIMTSMLALLSLFFFPLTSVVGHAFVSSSKNQMEKYFNFFYGLNFAIGTVFCLGYYAVIDNVIQFCFGPNLEESREIVLVIVLNYFIQFMRTSMQMFRSATGTFYRDRYKPIVEGSVNVVLSILFAKNFGVVGVIIATIITNLLICDVIEPYVVYKYALEKKAHCFIITNYAYTVLFAVCLLGLSYLRFRSTSLLLEFVVNGCIAIAVSLFPLCVVVISNQDFRIMGYSQIQKILHRKR